MFKLQFSQLQLPIIKRLEYLIQLINLPNLFPVPLNYGCVLWLIWFPELWKKYKETINIWGTYRSRGRHMQMSLAMPMSVLDARLTSRLLAILFSSAAVCQWFAFLKVHVLVPDRIRNQSSILRRYWATVRRCIITVILWGLQKQWEKNGWAYAHRRMPMIKPKLTYYMIWTFAIRGHVIVVLITSGAR